MSYPSPRRQPLSLVQNKSNSLASNSSSAAGSTGCSTSSTTSTSPGSTNFRKKLPSISALTSLHTSPKASLETSREGRASLSFVPFTSPETATSGKLRARATTLASSTGSINRHLSTTESIRSPPRPVVALGPARRTRSKTLSKSHSAATARATSKRALSQDERRHSCTFVDNDNLQKTLDLLQQHVEDQSRRLSMSSGTGSGSVTATPMLSAPMMQRTPSTPMMNNAPSTFATWSGGSSQPALQLSPPTLLPPYIAPDLELVYPSAPSSLASSTSSSVSQASSTQASLSPQVEQLSNLINDLSLFLPQADTLSSDQLQAFQAAVDTMLGKTPQPSVSTLGNAIQLRNDNANNVFADDMPTFYVGLPPSLHDARGAHTNPTHALYDPSTPQDVDMLGNSTSKPSYSMSSLEKDVGGMELQVQHNPPPYEARIDFSMLDNDLDLVPPRW